jgi:pimeloyl-ACP methyl ester carboxylesterase
MTFSRRHLCGIAASLLLAQRAWAEPDPIDERGFVHIGGIDQWIAVQGEDRRNPMILYLHGGPGEAQSPFLKDFAPWEREFTVVNWDQRGAGKTYEKNGKSTPDVTLNRLTDDAVEIAHYVLHKFGKPKLILVGQSFGAMLGLLVARRAPEMFYAFVGTGQFVNTPLTTKWREKWAREQALASHDAAGLKTLDEAAKLPITGGERMMASRKWIFGPPDQAYIKKQMEFIGPRAHPRPEAAAWVEGYLFEANKVAKEAVAFDAVASAPDLPVPYVLVEGRDDHVTPLAPAKAYYDRVRSEGKAFVPINGGHYACFTNSDAFLAALRNHVLPIIR